MSVKYDKKKHGLESIPGVPEIQEVGEDLSVLGESNSERIERLYRSGMLPGQREAAQRIEERISMDDYGRSLDAMSPAASEPNSTPVPLGGLNPLVAEHIEKVKAQRNPSSAAPKSPSAPKVDAELEAAQQQENTSNFLANMGHAGNTISSALGGIKNDTSFYDKMAKGASRPVDELQAQRKIDASRKVEDSLKKMQFEAAEERRMRAQTEKEMGELEKNVRGGLDVANAFRMVEGKIGFDLDSYNKDTNSVNGKSVDLPGVSVPGIGRVTFYGEKARELDGAMTRVFNVELKDRSGAAVTNPEMERMKQEFNSGRFNSEPDKLQALRDYKSLIRQEMINRQARSRPEIREEYRNRGGQLSEDILGAGRPSAPISPPQAPASLSAKDQEAITWAKQQPPGNPQAQQILKMHGLLK